MNTPLNKFDPEELNDWILAVEKSFGIEFAEGEIMATTADELHAAIMAKLPEWSDNSCTSQQAFYKLRQALRTVSSHHDIRPSTALSMIFPKQERHAAVRQLEHELGVSVHLLKPPDWLVTCLFLCLPASPLLLFFSGPLFVTVLFSAIGGLYFAQSLGRQLSVSTVGDLTNRLCQEHYQAFRRKPGTVNRQEVDMICRQWFTKDIAV
nr:hypothetical protein [uncultured Arsenicibacter sp.]